MPRGINALQLIVPSLIQDLVLFACRIVYTADSETTDDRATILKSVYSRPAASKGNVNRHFDNINYEGHKHVEYDDDDHDERSPVIAVVDGDIVWYCPTVWRV